MEKCNKHNLCQQTQYDWCFYDNYNLITSQILSSSENNSSKLKEKLCMHVSSVNNTRQTIKDKQIWQSDTWIKRNTQRVKQLYEGSNPFSRLQETANPPYIDRLLMCISKYA